MAAVATVVSTRLPDAHGNATIDAKKIRVTLDKAQYRQGERMRLVVRDTMVARRNVQVTDASGAVWTRVYHDRDRVVFTASAGDRAKSSVTVHVTRLFDGAVATRTVHYEVALPAPSGESRWPGHQAGKIVLGLSSADFSASLLAVGAVGLHRTYYGWSDAGEDKTIKADHASGRLPWVSFKPPGGSTAGWAGVASGAYDADIKARASRYAAYGKPVIATFHHEPTNDGGDPAQFAAAWVRIHDVMQAQAGLANVTFAPIIGDWEFNPHNSDGKPGAFLTAPVLERIPFLGVDLYQNSSNDGFSTRLARIVDWLDYHGVPDPMVGIGETGCCLAEDPHPEAWLQANWDWAVANVDKIGVMSYFDSARNSKDAHVWSLAETSAKTNTYRSLLGSSVAAGLI
jgi:hypothetical protein